MGSTEALGFIGWHHSPGQHLPAGTCAFGRVGGVPVASITYEVGAWLQRVARRRGSLRFRLLLDSRIERKDSWNVVGDTDHIDKVCIPGLTEAAAVNARIALHVANLTERPAARIDRSHVEEILHRYDRENASRGAISMNSRPSRLSMPPQLETEIGRPNPRKLKDAWVTIAPPMLMLDMMLTTGMILGKTCRISDLILELPVAIAARKCRFP